MNVWLKGRTQVLLRETEKLLENWKHPDPYRAPTAPGGMSSIYAVTKWTDLSNNLSQAQNTKETFRRAIYPVSGRNCYHFLFQCSLLDSYADYFISRRRCTRCSLIDEFVIIVEISELLVYLRFTLS